MKYILPLFSFALLISYAHTQEKFVTVSERQLPIAYEVDVLFVGGTTGNIAAAIETLPNMLIQNDL